jgi:hypothetical protein
MVYSIIYKSKADPTFNIFEIQKMLQRAKYFNKMNEITGIILYHKSQFIQLIEGEKGAIESLYASIMADERHHEVETILSKASNQSLWMDWSMAFYDFSDPSDQTNYLRLLLESSFENANKKEKNSEVLSSLRTHTSLLLDH